MAPNSPSKNEALKKVAERSKKQDSKKSNAGHYIVGISCLLITCLGVYWAVFDNEQVQMSFDLTAEYDAQMNYDEMEGQLTLEQRLMEMRKDEIAVRRKAKESKNAEKEKRRREKKERKEAKLKAKQEKKKLEEEAASGGDAPATAAVDEGGGGGNKATEAAAEANDNKNPFADLGISLKEPGAEGDGDDDDEKEDDDDDDDEEGFFKGRKLEQHDFWLGDEEMTELAKDVGCDWPVLNALDANGDPNPRFDVPNHLWEKFPYIIRGLSINWPARNDDSWQFYKLMDTYGNRSIPSDAGNSYVSGGGHSQTEYPLSDLLDGLRNKKKDEAFTFDPAIMKNIPELRDDIEVPKWFQSWMNKKAEETNDAWHMLSLAGTRNGLPYHTHGQTYMSLIHGRKWWMIYPPGAQPPKETFDITNPVQSTEYYVKHVLPTLMHHPKPPMEMNVVQPPDVAGYRPMMCVQEPGDVMYLPGSWQHQTLNIGEAIGLGGQAKWDPEIPLNKKYRLNRELLGASPDNVNYHRVQMMTIVGFVDYEAQRVKAHIEASTKKGMVKLNSNHSRDTDWAFRNFPYSQEMEVSQAVHDRGETQFCSLVMKGEDTWLILYMPKQPGQSQIDARTHYSSIWDAIALKMKGRMNVGMSIVPLELWEDPTWEKDLRLTDAEKFHIKDGHGEDRSQIVKMKLIPGFDRGEVVLTQGGVLAEAIDVDIELVQSNIIEICKFTYGKMKDTPGTREGSASVLTARLKRLFSEAEAHAYKVLRSQPYHPEMIGMLTEVLRATNKTQRHDNALTYFEEIFEPLYINATEGRNAHGMSRVGLASVYHKLAEAGVESNKIDWSLEMLDKSLTLSPSYQKSLADKALALIVQNSTDSIDKLKLVVKQAEDAGMTIEHPKFRIVKSYFMDLELNKTIADARAENNGTLPDEFYEGMQKKGLIPAGEPLVQFKKNMKEEEAGIQPRLKNLLAPDGEDDMDMSMGGGGGGEDMAAGAGARDGAGGIGSSEL